MGARETDRVRVRNAMDKDVIMFRVTATIITNGCFPSPLIFGNTTVCCDNNFAFCRSFSFRVFPIYFLRAKISTVLVELVRTARYYTISKT